MKIYHSFFLCTVILLTLTFLITLNTITGHATDTLPLLNQMITESQQNLAQAKQNILPSAHANADIILKETAQNIKTNLPSWTLQSQEKTCKELQNTQNAETSIRKLLTNVEKELEKPVQRLLGEALSHVYGTPDPNNPADHQKIRDGRSIVQAIIIPLIKYTSRQLLFDALQHCPPTPQRITPAITTPSERTVQTTSTASQIVDIEFKDAVFYYSHDRDTPIDKNSIEQAYEAFVKVFGTNVGSNDAGMVDVYVRYDDRNFEDRRLLASTLFAGASQEKEFILPSSSIGSHALTFRFDAKGDTNPTNNIATIPYTFVSTPNIPPVKPDLSIEFVSEKPFDQEEKIGVGLNELKANILFSGIIRIKNVGLIKSINPLVTVKINDKTVLTKKIDEVWPAKWQPSSDQNVIFTTQLPAGTHKFTATIDEKEDANQADNTITTDLIVKEEQPTLAPTTTGSLPDGIVETDLRGGTEGHKWLEQSKRLYPTELEANKDTIAHIRIRNQGQSSMQGKLFAYIDETLVSEIPVDIMKPNELDRPLNLPLKKLSAGQHTLRAHLDIGPDSYPPSNTFTETLQATGGPVTPTIIDLDLQPNFLELYHLDEAWKNKLNDNVDPNRKLMLVIKAKNAGDTILGTSTQKNIVTARILQASKELQKDQKETTLQTPGIIHGHQFYFEGLPPGQYTIEVTANVPGDTTPENNKFTKDITAGTPPPKTLPSQPTQSSIEEPNIALINIFFTQQGQKNLQQGKGKLTTHLSLSNKGIPNFAPQVSIRAINSQRTEVLKKTVTLDTLQAGETRTLSFEIDELPPDSYTFEAEITNDPNPKDNSLGIMMSISPPPQQPTQAWQAKEVITYDKDEYIFSADNWRLNAQELPENKPLKARFFLTNTGTTYALLTAQSSIDGTPLKETSTAGKVEPGKRATIWVDDIPPLTPGTHSLTITHAAYTINVPITVLETKPAGYTDAAIEADPTKLIISKGANLPLNNLYPQEPWNIEFIIHNKGTTSIQPTYTVTLTKTGTQPITPLPKSIGQLLGPGGIHKLYQPYQAPQPGTYTLKISTQTPGDQNSANNVYTITLIIQDLQDPLPPPTQSVPSPPQPAPTDAALDYAELRYYIDKNRDFNIDKNKIAAGYGLVVTPLARNIGSIPTSITLHAQIIDTNGNLLQEKRQELGTLTPNDARGQGIELNALTPGTYTLVVTALSPRDINPSNNEQRIPLTVVPKAVLYDVGLLSTSTAIFDADNSKKVGKNYVDIVLNFKTTSLYPKKQVPIIIKKGTQISNTVLNIEKTGESQTHYGAEVLDRNNFPKTVYVSLAEDDDDSANDAIIIPVTIKKDGQYYETP